MSHSLADLDPEQAIAALNRRRTLTTIGVLAGIVLAVVIMIAASAAMYSEEPGNSMPSGAPR